MSRNTIAVLIYSRHKLLELQEWFVSLLLSTNKGCMRILSSDFSLGTDTFKLQFPKFIKVKIPPYATSVLVFTLYYSSHTTYFGLFIGHLQVWSTSIIYWRATDLNGFIDFKVIITTYTKDGQQTSHKTERVYNVNLRKQNILTQRYIEVAVGFRTVTGY
jgi:hypothetical protein